MSIKEASQVQANVKVTFDATSGTLKLKGDIEPALDPEMLKAFSNLNDKNVSDVLESDKKTIKTGIILGGSSSQLPRGGRSRKGKKSKGGKSRKARKSLRRK